MLSKTELFSFGRFSINVTALPDLLQPLLQRWKAYHSDQSIDADISIPVCIDDSLCTFDVLPGWSCDQTDTGQIVSFCTDKEALFRLRLDRASPQRIALYIKDHNHKSLLLGIQHAVMMGLSPSCIGLHGVTLICRNKAIIVSAPSGTGKTTLAKLLYQYCDTATVNGDFALLSLSENQAVIFEPTPFCGTSGYSFNCRLPISRIVFLEQAQDVSFRALHGREALSRLLSNVFIPSWSPHMQAQISGTAMQILERIPADVFAFPPTQEAAETFYSHVIQ